ncbi:MAG: Lar family restriction alleviation protein [Oscillospiraceae bacterium]|nr:Lar family restriction alleviation protein [Oscillospiraceae bacterium]
MGELQLKPCPFCGSTNVRIFEPIPINAIGRAVICEDCNTSVGFPMVYDDREAAEYWNKRSDS